MLNTQKEACMKEAEKYEGANYDVRSSLLGVASLSNTVRNAFKMKKNTLWPI